MAKKKPIKHDEIAESFEDSLAELESIVGQLESGTLSLSDALARYEQGVKHLKTCQKLLERAERRIQLLSGVDASGNPISQPFDDEALDSLEEKATARGQRRTNDAKPTIGKSASNDQNVDERRRLF